ncbi:hypothetical protein J3U07_03285, partial [Gilliamella sp. B2881]|uniref:DUF6708 domain-containing protein n=2 Tax=Gilliamella TaxID=1193503 RepID=UPI00226A773D
MPSKYQPQILGWIGDLDKGSNYLTGADQRLLYANDNYCAFIRLVLSTKIFYIFIYTIALILGIGTIILCLDLILNFNSNTEKIILNLGIFIFFVTWFALYLVIPLLYQTLFSHRGSPIIFNRKTGKVYVNESYFFNFKVLRNPLTFLLPNKKRIKEYDWAYLQGVVVHNFSRYSLNSTILMVCKPNTNKTIDHI